MYENKKEKEEEKKRIESYLPIITRYRKTDRRIYDQPDW